MKRALIVSNVLGVVSDFLQNDIHILKEREYDITCAANTKIKLKNTDNFIKTNQINVVHIDFPVRELNIGKIILAYKQIRLLLKNNDFDLIHCHMPITSAITRFCARKYRKYGIKVLYTSHGFPFYKGNEGVKSRFFYLIERYLSRYTDCIITICNEDFENAKNVLQKCELYTWSRHKFRCVQTNFKRKVY